MSETVLWNEWSFLQVFVGFETFYLKIWKCKYSFIFWCTFRFFETILGFFIQLSFEIFLHWATMLADIFTQPPTPLHKEASFLRSWYVKNFDGNIYPYMLKMSLRKRICHSCIFEVKFKKYSQYIENCFMTVSAGCHCSHSKITLFSSFNLL